MKLEIYRYNELKVYKKVQNKLTISASFGKTINFVVDEKIIVRTTAIYK